MANSHGKEPTTTDLEKMVEMAVEKKMSANAISKQTNDQDYSRHYSPSSVVLYVSNKLGYNIFKQYGNTYPTGKDIELFIKFSKEGKTIDSISKMTKIKDTLFSNPFSDVTIKKYIVSNSDHSPVRPMLGIKPSKVDVDRFIELSEQGYSATEISVMTKNPDELFTCFFHPSYVINACQERLGHNIFKQRLISETDIKNFISLLQKGYDANEISRRTKDSITGISFSNVAIRKNIIKTLGYNPFERKPLLEGIKDLSNLNRRLRGLVDFDEVIYSDLEDDGTGWEIHHFDGAFNKIIYDAAIATGVYDKLNIKYKRKRNISEVLTQQEYECLIEKIKELHEKVKGIKIPYSVHVLFHCIYGQHDEVSEEHWDEFYTALKNKDEDLTNRLISLRHRLELSNSRKGRPYKNK